MNAIDENPYKPPQSPLAETIIDTTPTRVWRVRFTVSMWVCGVVGIQSIPVYPWGPGFWADQGPVPIGIHLAWLSPFCCSVASVVTSVGLIRLGELKDILGGLACIAVVGLMPGVLAINWWWYFVRLCTDATFS